MSMYWTAPPDPCGAGPMGVLAAVVLGPEFGPFTAPDCPPFVGMEDPEFRSRRQALGHQSREALAIFRSKLSRLREWPRCRATWRPLDPIVSIVRIMGVEMVIPKLRCLHCAEKPTESDDLRDVPVKLAGVVPEDELRRRWAEAGINTNAPSVPRTSGKTQRMADEIADVWRVREQITMAPCIFPKDVGVPVTINVVAGTTKCLREDMDGIQRVWEQMAKALCLSPEDVGAPADKATLEAPATPSKTIWMPWKRVVPHGPEPRHIIDAAFDSVRGAPDANNKRVRMTAEQHAAIDIDSVCGIPIVDREGSPEITCEVLTVPGSSS